MLTERELEILEFINGFGFCEIGHIRKRFKIGQSQSYEVMKKLKDLQLIRHQRILYGRAGIYRLTMKGARYTNLPALPHIAMATYHHQLAIIDVSLKLMQCYPNAQWFSERQLQHDKGSKRNHTADGVLILSQEKEEKHIAIEVELTLKGKNRLEKIFKSYATQFTVNEVWYYCAPALISPLTQLSQKMPFIKIHNLAETLL